MTEIDRVKPTARSSSETASVQQSASANVLWKPHYKQALALKCPAFELLFGGAAGGGKSDFLLVDFYAGVPKYGNHWKGILFRRTYDELGELMKRAAELYGPLGGKLINKGRDYMFKNGAILEFRYLEQDKHVLRYQGHQYTWIGFDELGNYPTDFAWRYMISRCRSAAGVPCYMRATANPGGMGHAWIKTRFVDGFEPYQTHRTVETTGTGTIPITRCFIPSLLEDNPTLMRNDPDYQNRLKLLPGHLYRALRGGDWDIFAGQVFDEWRRELHVVKPFALEPGAWKKFYALDWGYQAPFSLGKWAVNGDGRMVRYGEWYGCGAELNTGIKMDPKEAAAKAWSMAVLEGVTEVVADTSMWEKTSDAPSAAEEWERAGFTMIQAHKARLNGLMIFHQRLKTMCADEKPMLLVFDPCVDFIRTIPTLTPDPSNPEDVNTSLEDHIYDESRYAMMSDFAHNPTSWLRKQNGSWNFRKAKGDSWDPQAKWRA
jgi:hypothetical protein